MSTNRVTASGMTRSKAFTDGRELADKWLEARGNPAARRDILKGITRLIDAEPAAGIMTLLAFAHWMPGHTPASLVDEFQAYLWPEME